ncbi:ABC transporter ATP-binding protein [Halopenitus persicus]|uniref:ABC transporter ATP-binding protein n=1 Tax=Halopenitus persicus TaxID=1048396 RepID=UPI000BBAD67F|nr:ABC transporter ATP-binding protein [Halopenitus persicus]
MAILDIENLHAGYGQHLVLKGVDAQAEEGDITLVMGPNGAGKSTLFKTIFGLLDPSEGSITFHGEDITGCTQEELLDLGMAYVLQRSALFEDMTIRENLEMGAYVADRNYDVDGKIEEIYDLFPILEERSNAKAGTLSGGQRQMVEFGRGLMLDPEFMLIDEPTAGLAPKIIDQVFERVQQINETGVTIFMIEQNIKTGLQYSDYAYVLDNGATRFHGPADTILDNPEIRDAYLSENVSYEGAE